MQKFDVSIQSLETFNNGPVEACDIYLPDDSFAVNGVQEIVVGRVWHLGIRFVLAGRVERCGNLPRLESAARESLQRVDWLGCLG